jgi:hypothetical protein
MPRALAFLLLALMAAPAAADPPGAPSLATMVATETRDAWRAACRHYENRARFKSRSENVEFATVLADGCAAALAESASSGPEGAAARAFLDRVVAARHAVDAINARRLANAADRAGAGFSRQVRDLRRALRLVSETGEYLILRAEGVFLALDHWVASGARFSLAAALP